jgi:hypothetical protein
LTAGHFALRDFRLPGKKETTLFVILITAFMPKGCLQDAFVEAGCATGKTYAV